MNNPYDSPNVNPSKKVEDVLEGDEKIKQEYFEKIASLRWSGVKKMGLGFLMFIITATIWLFTGRLFYIICFFGIFTIVWGGFNFLFAKTLVDNNFST